MDRKPIPTRFDHRKLETLRRLYDQLCTELGISASEQDSARRNLLAKAIMEVATTAGSDATIVWQRTVLQLRSTVQ